MKLCDLRYVLSVLSGALPEREDVDFYSVLGFLELNKISGYFYNRTLRAGISLPQRVAGRLKQILRAQCLRNAEMSAWIGKLSKALKQSAIPHAFLKGSVLSRAGFSGDKPLYAEGERISNDIDILVSPREVGRVTALLKDMNFTQGRYDDAAQKVIPYTRGEILSRRMNRGETAPFVQKTEGLLPFIEVDVNFSLDCMPTGSESVVESMLSRGCSYSAGEAGEMTSLDETDFFIHLLVHQYKEMSVYSYVRRNKDMELYKLLDIRLFLARYGLSEEFFLRTKAYGLGSPCRFVLESVDAVFGGETLLSHEKSKERFYVTDPERGGKKYRWKTNEQKRLIADSRMKYLREVRK